MYQIVKFLFPFADNFDKAKPRPSLLISPSFGKHNHTILAYITTDLEDMLDTDIFIDATQPYFIKTGLRSSSLIKLHRLIAVTPLQIGGIIGVLPDELIPELKKKLMKVFRLK